MLQFLPSENVKNAMQNALLKFPVLPNTLAYCAERQFSPISNPFLLNNNNSRYDNNSYNNNNTYNNNSYDKSSKLQ